MTQFSSLIVTTITRISDTIATWFFVGFEMTQFSSLIIAAITKISNTIMNRFFVGFEMTQCCGLIFTNITRISDTFMNEFFVSFESTQLCSLIVATITRISDTIMNRFFVLFEITQFWCLILTIFTIVSGLIYWRKESIDTSFLAFTYEIKSISYHLSISKESNPNLTWPLASCKCWWLGAAPLRNLFLKKSQYQQFFHTINLSWKIYNFWCIFNIHSL